MTARPSCRSLPWRRSLALVGVAALGLAALGCGSQTARGAGTSASLTGYTRLPSGSLPGPTYRWDYQAFDPATSRLYLADLGQSQVVVFDTRAQRVVGLIKGVGSVHGIALAPELHLVLATATTTNQVVAADTESLAVVATIGVGEAPNGIAYAPSSRMVFVTDGAGMGDTVISATSLRSLGEVRLGLGIGNTIYDPAGRTIYVSLGNQRQLVALDPSSHLVHRRYALPGCQWPHGIQIDQSGRHRAFVACAFNNRLEVLDLQSGKVLQTLSTGNGPDVVALDPGLHRLYVASNSGILAVYDTSGLRVKEMALARVGADAHTVGVDTLTHTVYLPLDSSSGSSTLLEFRPDR